jgi:predicted ATPase
MNETAGLNNRFVITGGPGSGKTTLVEALQSEGFTGFPEFARELINQGITPPAWSEKPFSGHFFELILNKRISYHQQIKAEETGFYDRGIPDSIAYFRYQNKPIPEKLSKAANCYRYNPLVFVCPPWEAIYCNDSIRRETFAEAQVLYEITVGVYREFGYEIIELAMDTVKVRLDRILYCATK